MARYFFEAHYHGATVTDEIGEEFATLEKAEAYAALVARELARNDSAKVTVNVLSPDRALLAKTASG